MDSAWIGVIGTGVGALATGLPSLGSAIVQSLSARGQRKHDAEQARIKREADEAAAETEREQQAAEREAANAAELRAQRRQKIDGWRTDLCKAVEAEDEWRINNYGDILRPNLIGSPWFEEIRGYLSEMFSYATEVHADGEMVGHLSRMISHLEREWLGN
ncbi:hypothetical protein [Mycobacterium intracellulare]|uniref:hypothetical protein n=1 Tax=Mycobacterium intracellulare TaxID=1767 RepID=UPI00044E7375|nr:hypothetical protein [Mycobacterium intracellulare]ETZ30989.1 hypothetical protein L842_2048 [Mycobacterium intracellulare MIN_052511_1280]MCA2309602.1 hypothetical protein [Mycobacterium intracellulare subsp. chimaera]MCA2352719.1 hypothetical protein [Mycobacterium intracellulare subsp. chimaera]MCV7328103.1 hypothetical protein [Mycobacterium intracellulare subsp. chimaera]MDM3907004.1 hypothetical protein [Mycobacterium intracellulare subsp. chimaera]